MLKRAVAVTVIVGSSAAVSWAQARLGPEFQVNTVTTDSQRHPKVASDASGNFVVVWSLDQWTPLGQVSARRFDASGVPLGDEFQVSSYTDGAHARAWVAAADDGRFVVAWRGYWSNYPAAGTDEIFARRYDAGGNPAGDPFLVNADTTSREQNASVAGDAAGNFVVVWQAHPAAGDRSDVIGRSYDPSGAPRTGEFTVSDHTTGFAGHPSLAYMLGDEFIAIWDHSEDGSGDGIVVRPFAASSGAPLGGEFALNAHTTGGQVLPVIVAGGSTTDDFSAAWQSDGQDGSAHGVVARLRRGALRDEFVVNTYTTLSQVHPAIAGGGPRGSFVVAWTSTQQDGDGLYGVYARLFDGLGAPQGDEFRVNSVTTGDQAYPSVAFNPDGSFVVVWQGTGSAGSGYDIFGQRFLPDLIFRDDFEAWAVFPWAGASTDGGDLRRTPEAALKGSSVGLQGDVDDRAALYLQDDSPNDEGRYRVRFYVDPSGFDPGEAQNHFRTRLFLAFEEGPTRRVAAVVLRRQGGVYGLMGRARRDDDSQADTAFFPISAGAHFVEIDLVRASGPDANDGSFGMWIDGAFVSGTSGLDNSRGAVDFVRLGALSVKAGASGTLYWDEFESRRLNYIGP